MTDFIRTQNVAEAMEPVATADGQVATSHDAPVVRILKLEESHDPQVRPYQYDLLKQAGRHDYQVIKAKCGPLAATDPDKVKKPKRDSRFSLSPILRGPLAIEDEEKRSIDERVKKHIESVADEVKNKARDEGYQEGLKKGHQEAYQKLREESAERLGKFDGFLNSCENAKKEIFKENENFLIAMVFEIAKMIVLKEVKADKDYILRLAANILEHMGVKENITIKINPEDKDIVTTLNQRLNEAFGKLENLKIEESETVKGGGCIVETQWNAVDASIGTQLKSIAETLLGKTNVENK